jgi:hypothetical protein
MIKKILRNTAITVDCVGVRIDVWIRNNEPDVSSKVQVIEGIEHNG